MFLHMSTVNEKSEPNSRRVLSVQEKMDILVQVDTSKETHIAQAARWGIALSAVNFTVTEREDTRKCYVKYGRFFWSKEESESATISWTGESAV
jgi:ribosomal protein S9